MKYLLLFTALIATANALYCECTAEDCTSGNCLVEAGSGKCYSAAREILFEKGMPVNTTVTGCQENKVDATLCDQKNIFISSVEGFYLMSNITCCEDKNNCNEDIVTSLPKFSEVNKAPSKEQLFCPSCFALNETTCVDQQMNCSETQNKCFNISGTLATKGSAEQPQTFIAKGCAVESTILKNKAKVTFGDTSFTFETVSISDAKKGEKEVSGCRSQISGGLSFAILLPSVLWFLLDRTPY